MNQQDSSRKIQQHLQSMQIIAGALMMGVVFFGLISVFIGGSEEPGMPVISYVGAGFGALMLVMHFAIPGQIVGSEIKKLADQNQDKEEGDEAFTGQLCQLYQTKLIMALGILEAAAFLNLVVYIVSSQWWNIGTAVVLLLFMAMSFPTRNQLESWISDQKQMMEMAHS